MKKKKQPVAAHVDRWLFVAVFAIGAAGIILLKFYGYSQFTVTAWPVGMMVLYIADILFVRRFRIREDVAADNVYYLGFLYTMVSLSLALYLFSENGGTEGIITNFGIALATTILGLFGRIVINQFRHDPVEIERVARLELSEASSRLRSELDTIVLDVKSFHRTLLQSSAEMIEEAKQRALDSINSAADHLATHEEHLRQIKSTSSDTVAALRRLVQRIEKVDAPPDLLTGKVDRLVEAITATAVATERHTQAHHVQISQMVDLLKQASVITEANEKRSASLQETMQGIQDWMTTLNDLRGTVEASYRGLNDDVSKHTAIMTRMRAALSNHLETIEDQIGTEIEHRRAAISKLSENTNEASDIVQKHNAALASQLDMINTLYERLDTSVVAMLEMVTARLSVVK